MQSENHKGEKERKTGEESSLDRVADICREDALITSSAEARGVQGPAIPATPGAVLSDSLLHAPTPKPVAAAGTGGVCGGRASNGELLVPAGLIAGVENSTITSIISDHFPVFASWLGRPTRLY